MAVHKETRRLGYAPRQLFELIAQVERYPEFLPLWKEVHVSKDTRDTAGHTVYFTDQVIQLGPFSKRFRTKTILKPFRNIHIVSSDPLFRRFSIDWLLAPEKEDGCLIEFALDCVAASPLLRPVFEVVLLQAAQTIVSSFEHRAKSIYGHRKPGAEGSFQATERN